MARYDFINSYYQPMSNLGLSQDPVVADPEIGIVDSTGQGSIYENPQLPASVSPMGQNGDIDWAQMLAMGSRFLGGQQGGQQEPQFPPPPGLMMPPEVEPVPISALTGLFGLRGG